MKKMSNLRMVTTTTEEWLKLSMKKVRNMRMVTTITERLLKLRMMPPMAGMSTQLVPLQIVSEWSRSERRTSWLTRSVHLVGSSIQAWYESMLE